MGLSSYNTHIMLMAKGLLLLCACSCSGNDSSSESSAQTSLHLHPNGTLVMNENDTAVVTCLAFYSNDRHVIIRLKLNQHVLLLGDNDIQIQPKFSNCTVDANPMGQSCQNITAIVRGDMSLNSTFLSCFAINAESVQIERQTVNVTIVIMKRTSVTAPRDSKVVLANQITSINFICGAMGNPRPEISWKFNGASVTNARFQNEIIFINDSTILQQLILYQVQETDSGSIICVGRTSDPEVFVEQEKATLTVLTNNFTPEAEITITGDLQARFQLSAAIQDELQFLVKYTEAGTNRQREQTIIGNFINQQSILIQVPAEELPFSESQFTLQIAMEVEGILGEFTSPVAPTMATAGDPSLSPVAPIVGAVGGLVFVLAIATAMIVLRLRIIRRKKHLDNEHIYENISLYNMQFQPNCAYTPSAIASTTRQNESNHDLSDTINSDMADVNNRLHEDDQARNESRNGNTSESAINEASDSQYQEALYKEQSCTANHEQQQARSFDLVQDYIEEQQASGPYDQVQDYEKQQASGPYERVQDYEQQQASGPYERVQDYEQQPASGPYEKVQDYERQQASGPYERVQNVYEKQRVILSGPYDWVQGYEQLQISNPKDQPQDYEQPASEPYGQAQDSNMQTVKDPND